MGFDKARKLEQFSGKARAKGPVPFRAAREAKTSNRNFMRGVTVLEQAGVEDGFMVDVQVESKFEGKPARRLSGIIRVRTDLVSGMISEAAVDGQGLRLESILSVEVLVGRKEAPPQPVALHEDRA